MKGCDYSEGTADITTRLNAHGVHINTMQLTFSVTSLTLYVCVAQVQENPNKNTKTYLVHLFFSSPQTVILP